MFAFHKHFAYNKHKQCSLGSLRFIPLSSVLASVFT
nr:MAG TPA: hypothetical protein [Caudoviricetes sp.]